MSEKDPQKQDGERQRIDRANSRKLMAHHRIVKNTEEDLDKLWQECQGRELVHKTILENLSRDLKAFRDVLRNEAEVIVTIAGEYGGDRERTSQAIDAAKKACSEVVQIVDALMFENLRGGMYVDPNQKRPEALAEMTKHLQAVAEMVSLYWELCNRTQVSWS